MVVFFFFFKQKTAYEMRISDWSSDVCSSDLDVLAMLAEREARHLDLVALHPVLVAADRVDFAIMREAAEGLRQPPLRESVGRITLVKDRDAAFEQLVRKVGEEVREAFGEDRKSTRLNSSH